MIIYGRNPVKELLRNNSSNIQYIYINSATRKSFVPDVMGLSRNTEIKVKLVDNNELDRICGSTKHQGIAARIENFKYSSIGEILEQLGGLNKPKLIVILDHIEDPQNLGAIIRSVNVLGGDAVVIPKDRSASVTPSVVKASAGAVNFVPVAVEVNLSNVIKTLKKAGYWIVGADQNAGKNINDQDFSKMDIALLIGGEGRGLSPVLVKRCDFLVKIPQRGNISSLNASVAAGIIIHQLIVGRSA